MGIGFAIPTKTINEVLPILKEGKEVVRGYLGVSIRALNEFEPGIGKTFGLDEDTGILVEDVRENTPADKAGIRGASKRVRIGFQTYIDVGGDIIINFAGQKINSGKDPRKIIRKQKINSKIPVRIYRGNKEITIKVKLEPNP